MAPPRSRKKWLTCQNGTKQEEGCRTKAQGATRPDDRFRPRRSGEGRLQVVKASLVLHDNDCT